MAIRYIDFNRGSDAQDGTTPAKAWKSLATAFNFNPGAGGGLYLASDSVWEINATKAAHNSLILTLFNGAEGNPAFITSFDPVANTSGQKPTIRYRMFPVPSDWTWDETDNLGYPKGWYIQLGWHSVNWDCLVIAGGEYAGTMNQDSVGNLGKGYINGSEVNDHAGEFCNGMSRQTLRFNIDLSRSDVGGSAFTRLYLSGAGLLTPGAGNDPSSVYGPNQIMLGFRSYLFLYNSSDYFEVSNLRVEDGGGLLTLSGDPNRITSGFEVHGCEAENTSTPFVVLNATGDPATSKIEVDFHDNVGETLSGPFFSAYKIGIAGYFRNNKFTNGNLCSSMGGGVYMQIVQSTVGGVRAPFRVEYNIADTWKNGTGNNGFDGGCYYADIIDDGTIFHGNTALNSYVAFQCGSGAYSEWTANLSINCEKFGMWNNPKTGTIAEASDYHINHNLHIGAPQGTFTHGEDTEISPAVMVVTHNGTESNLVGIYCYNNCIVVPEGDTRRAAMILTSAHWTAGRAHMGNNVMICDNPHKVTCDVGVVDKTVAAGCLDVSRGNYWVDANYRIDRHSALARAGVDLSGVQTDANGQQYYSPPSVGPMEFQRKAGYFSVY